MSKAKALDYHYIYRLERGLPLSTLYDTEEERLAARRENLKRYYRRHRAVVLQRIARWKKRHPAVVKAQMRDHGFKRRGGSGKVTASQWARIVLFYGHRCAICHKKRPLTADHYVALKNGGGHSWKNVWPLCITCNVRKADKVYPGRPPHVVKLRKVI